MENPIEMDDLRIPLVQETTNIVYQCLSEFPNGQLGVGATHPNCHFVDYIPSMMIIYSTHKKSP